MTLSALQSVLGGLGLPQQAGAAPPQAPLSPGALRTALQAAAPSAAARRGPLLSDVLTPDVMLPALSEPGLLARLAPFLPESQRDPHSVAELVRSPQFVSQLEAFSRGLASGQMDLSQFGLSSASGFSVEAFLTAIIEMTAAERQGEGGDAMQE